MAEQQGRAGTEAERAFEEAGAAATGRLSALVERLVDRTGAHAGVEAVFGAPVERGGRVVIPVARSMWGGGAGMGEDEESGAGAGGGSGAMSSPVGYIEVTEHEARFVPLARPWQDPKLILATAFAIWLASRALGRILRR